MKSYIALIAATLMAVPAVAQQMPGDKLVCKVGAPGAHTDAERDQVAAYLVTVFSKLDNAIPTLSPTEAAWLKTEYDDQLAANNDTFTTRAATASGSIEMAKRTAKQQTDRIVATAGIISKYQYKFDYELSEWARLTSMIIDVSYGWKVEQLQKANVITESAMPRPAMYYKENMTIFGQCLLNDVIANIRP